MKIDTLPTGELRIMLSQGEFELAKADPIKPTAADFEDMLVQVYNLEELGYRFISPEEFGDLTDAPIIGLIDNPEQRWGFMHYATTDPADYLVKFGMIILQPAQ